MRGWSLPLAVVAVLALPGAQACSLAYQAFDKAAGSEDLRYVDGSRLVEVASGIEATLASGYFLSHAEVPEGLLVAGQDGLGGDCSGEPWLRIVGPGAGRPATPIEVAERAHVHAAPDSVHVLVGRQLHRYDGGSLSAVGPLLGEQANFLGVATQGRAIVEDAGVVHIGDQVALRVDGYPLAAANDRGEVALAYHDGLTAHVTLVAADGEAWTVRFAARDGVQDVRWADAWYVLVGGRAHHIGGVRDTVLDLGVDAVALGTLGGEALVFTENGYTAYEGVEPTGAARKEGPAWIRVQPPPSGGETELATHWERLEPEDPAGPQGGKGAPAPGAAPLAALGLSAAAWARRGRAKP